MLKRIDDIDNRDLTRPYYTIDITVRRVDKENNQGQPIDPTVVVSGTQDVSLINVNAILYAAKRDLVAEEGK